jgi:nitroimidazol reductase NimA-like FMN-containing flavoprotein (pyridoxamine 5'-phosphate oxidase superfamily)
MPSRREQIALSPAECREYLESSHTLVLSTIDHRGYPHAIAMWYLVDPDGSVVMTTFRKSQKVRNLERDPRCALLVESGRILGLRAC